MHMDDPGRVSCLHLYTEHWGRGWVGMIGGSLAPFGVVLDRLRGSIAPMTNRGGVVSQCPGPIARGIVNRGGVDVMPKNSTLFQPRFL